jgi:hypothetical protein
MTKPTAETASDAGVLEGVTPLDLSEGNFAVATPLAQPQRPWLSEPLGDLYADLGFEQIAAEEKPPLWARQSASRMENDPRFQTSETRLLRDLAVRWRMDPSDTRAMLLALFSASGIFESVVSAFLEELSETDSDAIAMGNARSAIRGLGAIAADAHLPFAASTVFLTARKRLSAIVPADVDALLRDLAFTTRRSMSSVLAEAIALAAEKWKTAHPGDELLDHKGESK